MSDDLQFAHELADIADRESMQRWRARDLVVVTKPDMTPVSDADRAVETALRARIAAQRPGHSVLGEEYGHEGSDGAAWRWVIDPIDGTRSFVRGNETWATLIALQREGETVVAVASMPALGQRYHAVLGEGAALGGRPMRVSQVKTVEDAIITHTSLRGFAHVDRDAQLLDLARRCWDARGLGNSMSHLLVARGTADIGWTSRANVWDFAALALIVREAGGRFTDRSHDDPVLGGTGISSNGLLHDVVLGYAKVSDP